MKPRSGNLYAYYFAKKEEIKERVSRVMIFSTDVTHCAACVCESIIGNDAWNNIKKHPSEHYAAVLAVIVHCGFFAPR